MKHRESKLQQACIKWFRLQYPGHIMFAIPNGGKRGIVTASIMKAEGVLAGIPDLFLATRNKFSNGLFIEMKTEKGKLSESQISISSKLIGHGYSVVTARSFDSFKQEVESYLNNYGSKSI